MLNPSNLGHPPVAELADHSAEADELMVRTTWAMIATMAIIVAVSFAAVGLRIDFLSNRLLIAIALIYALIAAYYVYVRDEKRIGNILIIAAQFFLTMLLGLLLTYAVSAVGLSFKDPELYAADLWIGFDRMAYRTSINTVPYLGSVLDAAYKSIQLQTALVPLTLILAGQVIWLQRFVVAVGISLVATSLIAVFVPAVDAMIHVDLSSKGIAALPPGTYTHIPTLEALRSGAMSVIRLDDLEGLITFPSFHTTIAILFAWALWPVRYVRAVGLPLNTLMIASTPISGSHYLIDIIGGAIVAVVAVAAASWCSRRRRSLLLHSTAPLT